MIFIVLAAVTAAAAAYALYRLSAVNRHWQERGVPSRPALPLFGHMLDLALGRRSHDEILGDVRRPGGAGAPLAGYCFFVQPRLVVNDVDLVERLLVKDFAHFADRARPSGADLGANLFGLTGAAWRALRSKFSPMFTVGKLRSMFGRVSAVGDDLVRALPPDGPVDVKEATGRFAVDVIASTVFGVEPGAVGEPGNEFAREARLAFKPSLADFARKSAVLLFPRLSRRLGLAFTPKRTVDYFSAVVRSALESRKSGKTYRRDFVQMMVAMQEKGYVELEKSDPSDDYLNIDGKTFDADGERIELTDDVMVSQAFVFLVAGFEAAASAMTFACLELALNPDAQERAREEIRKITRNGEEMTYDQVKDMRYLDNCVKETLRLHSPVGHLLRVCVKTYRFPGTSLVLEPGDHVVVPSQAIHMDPNIYRDPDRFSPERWNVTESVKRPPCTYLPFGDGPRMCIGMRFAIMEVKCCLAKILLKYRIGARPELKLPVKMNPRSFFNEPLEPILCNFQPL